MHVWQLCGGELINFTIWSFSYVYTLPYSVMECQGTSSSNPAVHTVISPSRHLELGWVQESWLARSAVTPQWLGFCWDTLQVISRGLLFFHSHLHTPFTQSSSTSTMTCKVYRTITDRISLLGDHVQVGVLLCQALTSWNLQSVKK